MSSEELQELFSANLKSARNRANLSQMKLAEKANLSVGYICDLESKRRWGTPETFSKLAQALGINAYELLLPVDMERAEPDVFARSARREYVAALSGQLRENISSAVNKAVTDTFAQMS